MAKKRLEKSIEGTAVTIKELETGKVGVYDFKKLPPGIQANFGPFGLGHKLGDAAAGKSGQAAVDSIDKVWEGLMAGNWAVRAPAAPKYTKKELNERISQMSAKDQAAAKELLAKLKISL